jgi:DNA-binding winged helix-turn-helix (wHTH) protein
LKPDRPFFFEPFHLDVRDARLFRSGEPVPLTPKAFGVLCHLLRHAGRLVTKEELIDAVWEDAQVSDASLKVCVREIRQALGDEAQQPRFVETVHRRGYRFIGKLSDPPAVAAVPPAEPPPSADPGSPRLVGREEELRQLAALLAAARQGQRQVVFLTGEPGTGKTALLGEFTRRATAAGAWVAVGQCFEQFGPGEPFLPVLEAISRLCRDPRCDRLVSLLATHAPTWLVQLPWLQEAAGRDVPPREVLGATAERMLREICEALEALTAETPLVLVLEDAHWSDLSTVDLLPALARRRQPARLLLVATYRPVEAILGDHPLRALKQDLQARGLCREVPVGPLDAAGVAEYLARRFPDGPLPADLPGVLFGRTEGNPLFMTNLVDDWLARGKLLRRGGKWEWCGEADEGCDGLPESVRALIEQRVDRLGGDERRVLEAASAAGREFSAAAVAAALDEDEVTVESCCEGLAKRHLILEPRGAAEWPDGTTAGRYGFHHELYRETVYCRLPVAHRARLHRRIGDRLEAAHGAAAADVAAELAGHFEQGRDFIRAVTYLRRAAGNAARRGANREAVGYLGRALTLADRLPAADRPVIRLAVLEQRGLVRRAGGDLSGAAADFAALADDAGRLGLAEQEAGARLYLASALSWGDRAGCLAAVDGAVALLPRLAEGVQRAHVRGWAGYWNLLWRGWDDADARACEEATAAARQAGDPSALGEHVGRYSYFLSLRSRYDEASAAAEEGARLALAVGDASEYLLCHFFQAWALLHRGRWGELLATLAAGTETADKNGHRPWSLFFRLESAWLHEQAGDFDGARVIAEAALGEAGELRLAYGEVFSLIVLGFAHLALGDVPAALGCFEWAGRVLDGSQPVMAWVWRMPLHLGLSECRLAQGDAAGAAREADRLCEVAGGSGERSYLALGRRMRAEAALAEGKHWRAGAELGLALVEVETGTTPLAAWRVYETAARLNPTSDFANRRAAVRRALADSLGDGHPLAAVIERPRS